MFQKHYIVSVVCVGCILEILSSVMACNMVLGILGPGQLGPGAQLSGTHLSGAQMSGASCLVTVI